MVDWVFNLPWLGMAIAVFLGTFLVSALIHLAVARLAANGYGEAFKMLSPGMLPPLGIMFGLLVGFIAAQVWTDFERAKTAVASEAIALRSIVVLSRRFPGESEARIHALVNKHIETAVKQEWPDMAMQRTSLKNRAQHLIEAIDVAMSLNGLDDSQKLAQREMVSQLQQATDARRQRIILSETALTPIKWTAVLLQALATLIAIAMVHSANRLTSAIALGLFSTGIALSIMLLGAYARPFSGDVAVRPDLLEQVIAVDSEGG